MIVPSLAVRWLCALFVLAALSFPEAEADTITYQVRGSGGAVWALGDQPGTEFVAFGFTDLLPVTGENPTPGPRLTFSLTRWSLTGGAFVRRQWYGDVALNSEALRLGADLTEASLEVEVSGNLEERTLTGVTLRRDVPGRIQMRWTPSSNLGVVTASFIYQTPPYLVTLQLSGQGRSTHTSATITVEALGGSITVGGFGSLTGTTSGTLGRAMQ